VRLAFKPASTVISGGIKRRRIRWALRQRVLYLAMAAYGKPAVALRVLRQLTALKRTLRGSMVNQKWIRAGGRHFWNINTPGFPSVAFDRFVQSELNRIIPMSIPTNRYQSLIFSITSRCPLQCRHCYEWSNLRAEETLSLAELQAILAKFQAMGVSNIQLSGGEPLCRFDDLIALLKSAQPDTDFWILTSGFGLDKQKAAALQKAGLTGVVISLDHWDEAEHNRFRGNDLAFSWVWEAAQNAADAGLAVALSLCVTREFLSEENLLKYLHLAKAKGIGLVRILEPRAVGHYEGQDIEMSEAQLNLLDSFFLKANSDPAFADLPILDYLAYYQRRTGCFGGDRYLYVDSLGNLHACPFCQRSAGNALQGSLEESLAKLKTHGCLKYPAALDRTFNR